MLDLTATRASTSVLIMARLAEEYGLSRGDLLASAGIGQDAPEVTVGQELQVVRELAARVPASTGLGLAAGLRYHLGSHGVWGWAIATSPTLRKAITFGPQHLGLTYGFCAVTADPARAALTFDHTHLPQDVREFLLWRDIVATTSFAWELFVSSTPVERVELALSRPPYAEHVAQMVGAPVTWEAAVSRIVYREHLADLPLPQADVPMHAVAVQRCLELAARRRRLPGGAADVRELLMHDPSDMPTIDQAAAALHTSARSLRRRLAGEGCGYRQLVEEVRRSLAEQYLTVGMTVEATARRLGYSETAAFTHAFSRWTGSTPTHYRDISGNIRDGFGS